MDILISNLKELFPADLLVKEIKIKKRIIYIIFLESLCSSSKINDYILKILVHLTKITELKSKLAGIPIKNTEIPYYLENGYTIVLAQKTVLAIETRADINRSIGPPESEPALNGPKDSFNECYQTNIGLIKRRIKTSTLKIKNYQIGKRTNTLVGVLYCEDIVDDCVLAKVNQRLNQIMTSNIIDSAHLSLLLQQENKSIYPTILKTERPDTVSNSLLEGKIAIVVDTSPFVLVLPAFLIDFINPQSDNYSKAKNINFVKILRLLSFFISMLCPAFYIAIINYNQEIIPIDLLVNFTSQRIGVPFPAGIEAILMLVVGLILRESDLRFPQSYGNSVSILGALILGEAAVSAGIVSPIMIITVALTFITSLMFTEYELINVIRRFRFIFLIGASAYGIIGMILAYIYFLITVNETQSFGKPYFFPIAPYGTHYFKQTVIKVKRKYDSRRSPMIAQNDLTK